jgi:hypothetical protein
MSLIVSLYSAILFFVLVPGILLSLPPKGNKFVVAGVHALVFALIFHFTHKLVWRLGASLEGFETPTAETSAPSTSKPSKSEPTTEPTTSAPSTSAPSMYGPM